MNTDQTSEIFLLILSYEFNDIYTFKEHVDKRKKFEIVKFWEFIYKSQCFLEQGCFT